MIKLWKHIKTTLNTFFLWTENNIWIFAIFYQIILCYLKIQAIFRLIMIKKLLCCNNIILDENFLPHKLHPNLSFISLVNSPFFSFVSSSIVFWIEIGFSTLSSSFISRLMVSPQSTKLIWLKEESILNQSVKVLPPLFFK